MFVRDMRDTSVRSADHLREIVPVPVLTEIAQDRRVPTRPLLVDDPFASPRAEAFRKLRTNLQFLNGRRGRGVIVVTSARMGEGTSTTACNLAITLAEVQDIQRRLTALGFDTGGTDGRVGDDTMRAVRDFQRKIGMRPADGYAGITLLSHLRSAR